MMYAIITNGQIARIDQFNGPMPAHKLVGRTDLLPIEDVTPTYDAETQALGGETLVIEAGRVVRVREVVARPEPVATVEDKLALLEKRNAALEATLIEKLVVTKVEVDAKVAVAVDAEVKG
jgi:hypothetical protein